MKITCIMCEFPFDYDEGDFEERICFECENEWYYDLNLTGRNKMKASDLLNEQKTWWEPKFLRLLGDYIANTDDAPEYLDDYIDGKMVWSSMTIEEVNEMVKNQNKDVIGITFLETHAVIFTVNNKYVQIFS